MESSKYTHIIWDWNGTLLDDNWLCVEVMNTLLSQRNLPLLTLERYRDIFDFPVKDYYEKLGFDFAKESFEVVGMDFMIGYNQRQKECRLHEDVENSLKCLAGKGFRQNILSAREQNELRQETIDLGVAGFFDNVDGLDDHYAHGKTGVGIRLLKELNVAKGKILFIGDTSHDADVAKELGIDCILIPNGHHSEERLISTGFPIVKSLNELSACLCNPVR
ncbi:MAG: HAD hydrolase-like protein [Bacteroidales bacterium]|jgi:phosphoglycolate phosphatase